MLVAAPIYLIILALSKRKEGQSKFVSKDGVFVLFLGLIGYYLASLFDFQGLKYIAASLERVILFLYPTLVLIITSVVFKEKIEKNHIIAILISYIGVSIAYIFDGNSSDHTHLMKGAILIFMSALTYASYLVGSQWLIPKLGTVRFTAMAMVVSCLSVIIHYLLTAGVTLPIYQREVLQLGVLMGIFSTVVPSFLISAGIHKLGATKTAILSGVGPVSTIVLSVIFLGEVFHLNQVVGTLLVLAGVIYISVSKSKPRV